MRVMPSQVKIEICEHMKAEHANVCHKYDTTDYLILFSYAYREVYPWKIFFYGIGQQEGAF